MSLRKSHHRSFYVYGLVLLLICINPQQPPAVVEAQSAQWSAPQTIPGYDPETWPPILIADQNRTVHAFSSQWIRVGDSQSARAIVYNRWTLDQGWTTPIDIILSPSKEARLTDAHLDNRGMFHIAFFGGDNTAADIYYSKAPAAIADDPRAWSTPVIIGENAGDPEGAVFVENDQATLYVVYNGRQLGNGIYVVNSHDGGESWSDPTPIFFTRPDQPNISGLHGIKGSSGWFHAAWNTLTIAGQGRGIYYARSIDGKSWSDPILLDSAESGYGILLPVISEFKNLLFVIYIQSPKVMMRLSPNHGKSWQDPVTLFSRHVGVNGSPSIVVDSNQGLHLFFGQRIDATATRPAIHGMWHSVWMNGRWMEPEAVVKGPAVHDFVSNKGFDPYFARAVVSQGNVILVTWRTDPLAGPNGIWYSYRALRVPELPIVPLPAPVLSNSPEERPITQTQSRLFSSSVPVVPGAEMREYTGPDRSENPSRPLMLALFASIFFLLVAIRSFTSGHR